MENKDIIQSYILTVAKYDSNVYVKRILTHIVNANQDYIEGKKLEGIINIEEDLFKDREYTLNAKELLLSNNDKNYKRIYDAFDYLQSKFFAYEDDDVRFRVPFVTAVYGKKNDGRIRFRMSELIHRAFTDFTKGFRRYELQVSLSLSSVYSIRLYELLSGQKSPLPKTIQSLKEMFQITDKYARINDFIRFVIEPAKKELDEKSPVSFEYGLNKRGKKYHSITFYPIAIPKNRDEDVERKSILKQVALSYSLDRIERDYFRDMGFTDRQLKNNHDTIREAKILIPDLLFELSILKGKMREKKNPQGWIIASLKGKIKDIKNRIPPF